MGRHKKNISIFVKASHFGALLSDEQFGQVSLKSDKSAYPTIKAGVNPKSRILAGYYVFNANISFTFQAIKNLYAHLTYLCFGLFCKFFGDF